MGCCAHREKGLTVTEEQKWDYITLSDFKSTSCLTPFSYVWLWMLVLISAAVYAADAFTAVNLLAFNKWSSQVKPTVPFEVTKWIFAVCIIISYVFLIYRWIRAFAVIRAGSVAECYLEPMAAIWQSMRLTKEGQGWRRFLVFAELTKSRKGVDYIALFVYFQFKSALIIVVAQGPRIAINAMTLWAVMEAQLLPVGDHASKDRSAFLQFFVNIQLMVEQGNKQESIIYFTMLFSLVIWVISALSLLLSVIFWIFFLWHYVPSSDGSLSKYCRRKIDARLERIVGKKIRKALEKQDAKRRKEEREAIKKGEADGSGPRVPTLPKLGGKDDDASSIYSMSTVMTLPSYSNGPTRTNTMTTTMTTRTVAMQPPLPSLNERPFPTRSDTQGTDFSTASYGSNAPLLSQANGMGMASPAPPMPALDRNVDYYNGPMASRPMPNGMPNRPFSPMSQGRTSPGPPRAGLPPVNTNFSNGRTPQPPHLISQYPGDPRAGSPAPSNAPYGRRPGPNGPSPLGDPTFSPYDTRSHAMGPSYEMSPVDLDSSSDYYPSSNSPDDYRPPQLPSALRPGSPAQVQTPAAPPRAGTAPPSNPRAGLPATLQSAIQRREMAAAPQQRSATAPIQPGYAMGPGFEPRSHTASPGPGPRGYDNGY